MEIKYLSEQDSGDICFPICHVKGVVGLDVNPSTNVSSQDIPLTSTYLVTGSKARVVYFDNITYVSADIQLTAAGITYLQAGNVISMANSGFNNTENVVLDCVITNSGSVASGCMGYIWIENGAIYIKATCKQIEFTADINNPNSIIETEVIKSFNRIVGNALSTTKTFAPVKPVTPNGYVVFSIPQRVTNFTLGPIESIGEIEFEVDNGQIEYTTNANYYYIAVSNTTADYNLTVKGKFTTFVYPKGITIPSIEIRDCSMLTWFSVNIKGDSTVMAQNTSLTSFALYGKHKMTNMTYFLSNLPLLTSVPNLSTAGVTSLRACFYGDTKLTKLPEMDFSVVNNVRDLCYGCTSLSYIPGTMDWSKVVDAGRAFYQCGALTTIPTLNTDALMYADYMYFGCNKLSAVNMNAIKLTAVDNIFVECSSLSTLIMTSLVRSVNTQDTNLKTKAAVINFIDKVAAAAIGNPSTIYLPQAVALYGFDNNFIQQVTNKNWKLG